jgi:hypothetical protein
MISLLKQVASRLAVLRVTFSWSLPKTGISLVGKRNARANYVTQLFRQVLRRQFVVRRPQAVGRLFDNRLMQHARVATYSWLPWVRRQTYSSSEDSALRTIVGDRGRNERVLNCGLGDVGLVSGASWSAAGIGLMLTRGSIYVRGTHMDATPG